MTLPRPSLLQIASTWIGIGCQSFGGGATTFALIERAVVRERRWLTEAEYLHDIALAQLSPGINLLGMTILIGKRIGGVLGVTVSLTGLLLPSVALTMLITAVYAHVSHQRLVQEALRGIIPATVGLGLLTAFGLARTQLVRREGRVLNLCLMAGSASCLAFLHLPVVVILLGAGLIGAGGSVWRRSR
jgi:chromate transporter